MNLEVTSTQQLVTAGPTTATNVSSREIHQLKTLESISAALKGAERPEQLAGIFLEHITEIMGSIGCAIFRLHHQSQELSFWRIFPSRAVDERKVSAQKGILGHAIRHENMVTTYFCDGIAHLPMKLDEKEALGVQYDALAVPMSTSQGEQVGAFLVHLDENQLLNSENLALLSNIATMAANVLKRANTLDTLEQMVNERTKELRVANEQLLELDRLKNKFIEDMSHELRTPLTSMGLYIRLLEKNASQLDSRYIDALRRQTTQLSTLVNSILDSSNPERTGGLGHFVVVDLSEIVRDVVQNYLEYAEDSGLAMNYSLQDGCLIEGNEEALRRMISNLLDNAIRYTDKGSIAISLIQRGQHVHLQISDTGMGIPESDFRWIFERFYRGSEVSQLNIPGSGLGLSMVKQIVDHHIGTISVDSEVNRGTTFCIEIPTVDSRQM